MSTSITTLAQAARYLNQEDVVIYNEDGSMSVEGKQLLGVCGYKYTNKNWGSVVDRQISKHSLVEGVDFKIEKTTSYKGRKSLRYYFTFDSAQTILLWRNLGIVKHTACFKENMFKALLYSALYDQHIIGQHHINGKFIDFYLPEYKLAIEYDEDYHLYRVKEDTERQIMIEGELHCTFIRVKQGQEGKGIRAILEYINANNKQ